MPWKCLERVTIRSVEVEKYRSLMSLTDDEAPQYFKSLEKQITSSSANISSNLRASMNGLVYF